MSLQTCHDCEGSGEHPWAKRNPAGWAGRPCPTCGGKGERETPDWAPTTVPEHQQRALQTEDYSAAKRKLLDIAKDRTPGTKIWRGETRHMDHMHEPPSVGLHWSVNPDQVVTQTSDPPPDHLHMVWEGEISHRDQAFDRSHPMWSGKHMSMDSEAEVRFKPGEHVRLTRNYVHDTTDRNRTLSPFHPGRSSGAWQAIDMDQHVPVQHGAGGHSDYSDVGIHHTAKIDMGKYFRGGVGDFSEIPDLFKSKYVHMNDSFWARQPVEQVPLDDLHSTQSRVWQKHLDANSRGEGDSEDHPRVINHQGRNWVFDGHHRAVNAIDAGETHMDARVYRTKPSKTAAREPGSVDCWVCGATGDDNQGGECEFCDGSRYLTPGEQKLARCPCGEKVTRTADGGDWLTHLDGSTSHDKGDVPQAPDGSYPGVADAMRMRGFRLMAGWQKPGDRMTRMHPRHLLEHTDSIFHNDPVTHALTDSMRTHGWDEERGQQHVEENHGVLHVDENPVTLWHTDQGSFVEPGNHRVPAAVRAGLKSIPVLVKDRRSPSLREEGSKLGYRPSRRIFGPTYGLDERLFDGEQLKPAVRLDLMAKWHRFCAEQGLAQPDEWSIVYFAGSEASEWTSPERKGNNDFDVLVGVDAQRFAQHNEPHALGVETGQNDELAHELTSRMRESDLVDPHYVLPGGDPDDPWDQTWYVNPNSYRIADIKPYAAYDVTHDVWAVKPPHLPDWDVEKFPEGHALVEMGDAYDQLVDAILKLPEPYRTQQGNALWEHLHGDRSRAFSPQGEGWYDPANIIEKWQDQRGTWKDLWELHHRAEEDPSTLLAPADWSNDPGQTTRT